MSYKETIAQWEQTVSMNLPHLSRPQAMVLALWSCAMILGLALWEYHLCLLVSGGDRRNL